MDDVSGLPFGRVPRVAPSCPEGSLLGASSDQSVEPCPDRVRFGLSVPPACGGMREAIHVKLSKRSGAFIAAGLAGTMVLSACGGSDEGSEGESAAEATGGTFSIYVGEPENPLVPGNTTESEGSQVVDSLWTGLVEYAEDGSIEYTGVAESIESEDNTRGR